MKKPFEQQPIIYGYWAVRGKGQIARLLLAYTGIDFVEKEYQLADMSAWFQKDKQQLGLAFPNLPYIIDQSFKITETTAIHNYIIQKSGQNHLKGKSPIERAEVDQLLAVAAQIYQPIKSLATNPDYEKAKIPILQRSVSKLNALQKYLGNRQFFMGYLTIIDFYIAQYCNYFEAVYPAQFNQYSFMRKVRKNLNSLTEIQRYYTRGDARKQFIFPMINKVQISDFNLEKILNDKQDKIKLGYWNRRGTGQVCRLLLAYAKVAFEEVIYDSQQQWAKDQANLNFLFPSLPYLITPQVQLTDYFTISKYIIEKWAPELDGKTLEDKTTLQCIVGVLKDILVEVLAVCYQNCEESKVKGALSKVGPKLKYLNQFVGDKTTVLKYLTYTDFGIAEISYYLQKIWPQQYKEWECLSTIRNKIESLVEVEGYYTLQKSVKGQFLSSKALINF